MRNKKTAYFLCKIWGQNAVRMIDSTCDCMLRYLAKLSLDLDHMQWYFVVSQFKALFYDTYSVFTADSKTCRERVPILYFSIIVKSSFVRTSDLMHSGFLKSGLTVAAIFWHLIHFIHFCPNIWNPISRPDLVGIQCNVFSQHSVTWYKVFKTLNNWGPHPLETLNDHAVEPHFMVLCRTYVYGGKSGGGVGVTDQKNGEYKVLWNGRSLQKGRWSSKRVTAKREVVPLEVLFDVSFLLRFSTVKLYFLN